MTHQARTTQEARLVTINDKPLLKALIWQGQYHTPLPEEEVLAIYERNWDFAGLLATPDAAELAFIHRLGQRHKSWLATAHVTA